MHPSNTKLTSSNEVTSGGNLALKIARGESNVFVNSISWVIGSNGGGRSRKAVFRNVAYKTLQPKFIKKDQTQQSNVLRGAALHYNTPVYCIERDASRITRYPRKTVAWYGISILCFS